jgi:Winged helix-turn helix
MGVSLSTVNRAHMTYDHGGIKALKPKPSGGRKRERIHLFLWCGLSEGWHAPI